LVDWEIGRLGDWLIGRLEDWLIGGLGDWGIGGFYLNFKFLDLLGIWCLEFGIYTPGTTETSNFALCQK
jgi:hypothetical protein